MRFVIYDDESLEPITVLNLPLTEYDALHRRVWRVAVPSEVPLKYEPVPEFEPAKVVDIWFEPFVRGKQRSVFAFTRATELAMLLNPAWLPGQRRAVDYLQEQNDRLTDMLMRAL